MEGSTLHKVIGLFGLLLCQTLSGCIQLEVMVLYVGIFSGNVITMLCSVMRLISGLIMPAELYRCQLLLVSQRGWCWLKLPSQSMWSVGDASASELCVDR